jgi:hypothetical protein
MRKGSKPKAPAAAAPAPAAGDTKKKGKQARKWDDDEPGQIDYSEKRSGEQEVPCSTTVTVIV